MGKTKKTQQKKQQVIVNPSSEEDDILKSDFKEDENTENAENSIHSDSSEEDEMKDSSRKSKSKSSKMISFSAKSFEKALVTAFKTFHEGVGGRNSNANENADVRIVPEADRLTGRKTYKTWKRMVDLDLLTYDLTECVEEENGGDPEWSEKKRKRMNARAQKYLNNAVSHSIKASIVKLPSAYAAMTKIRNDYGENETQDAVDLYRDLMKLKFKRHYDKQRYVDEFEALMANFAERNIEFDDNFKRIMFLDKIEGIEEPGSSTATFYTSMCIQQKENRSLAFVRQQFLNLQIPKGEREKSKYLKSKGTCLDLDLELVDNSHECDNERSSEKWENEIRKGINVITNTITDSNKEKRSHDSNSTNYQNNSVTNTNGGNKRRNDSNDHGDRKRFKNDGNSGTQQNYRSNNSGSNNNNSKSSRQPDAYKHPASTAPDGRYWLKGILVIPGTKPMYPKEKFDEIVKLPSAERRKLQCDHCGQYFHNPNECKNPGKQCFRCYNFGHTGQECPIISEKSKYSVNIQRSDFIYAKIYAIDSASNGHLTNDKFSLIDYKKLETPRKIHFNISGKSISANAIGIGQLPILIKWRKGETIVVLKDVFYSPEAEENIIGAHAFNHQFSASIILNVKSGHIFARKINSKIAELEVRNGIYYLHGKTQKFRLTVFDPNTNSSVSDIDLNSKYQCNLTQITNVPFDPTLSVQHLPWNVRFDVNGAEEGERLDPIDYSKLDLMIRRVK